MQSDQTPSPPPPSGAFTVEAFQPADAPGIVSLFRAVYGEGYPIRLFYDPEALTAANAEGQYYSIVARSAGGQVIGVEHLFRSSPDPRLYEIGVGLVLKEYRGAGVNGQMMRYLFDTFIPRMPGIEATFGEAVCYHTQMQRSMVSFRHIDTAIEVALMPGETYGKEKATRSRVATVNGFRTFKARLHQIHLPARYEAVLRGIYARLDDRREIRLSAGELPADVASQLQMSLFSFAQVARVAAAVSGGDLGPRLASLEAGAREQGTVIFQVWLNLAEPWVGAAAECLRSQGYFFGGALPRWFGSDGLLMQKLLCPPDFEDIQLETEDSKQLLAFIRKDWEEAGRTVG